MSQLFDARGNVEATGLGEDEISHQIAQERNQELQELESDMVQITEIFQTLAEMVDEQREHLDIVVAHVEESSLNVQAGTTHLECASMYAQPTIRKRLISGALVCGGVALGGVALIFLSPLAGLIAAGCGTTGALGCLGGLALTKK